MSCLHTCLCLGFVGVCATSKDIIIVLLIVPHVGVELDVINHVNPRKNNVNLGVKSKQKKKIKIN